MAHFSRRTALALGSAALAALGALALATGAHSQSSTTEQPVSAAGETQTAIFAGGCFWCVEKDFDHVEGVLQTVSGYIGGRLPNPTYQTHVGAGDREAVEITYDPSVVTYEELTHSFSARSIHSMAAVNSATGVTPIRPPSTFWTRTSARSLKPLPLPPQKRLERPSQPRSSMHHASGRPRSTIRTIIRRTRCAISSTAPLPPRPHSRSAVG